MPQDSLLFDGSIQENIALTRPEASFEEIQTAAQVACADSFIQDLPSGYSTKVGERGSNLSGGQKQRIAIARMVLKQPKMLILDEATSSLDNKTESNLSERNITGGLTQEEPKGNRGLSVDEVSNKLLDEWRAESDDEPF